MNEMVERVARLLVAIDFNHPRDAAELSEGQAERIDGIWRSYTDDARVVIAAMREPTAAMRAVGGDHHSGNDYLVPDEINVEATNIYQAMIDAAGSESAYP
jgi:hypothetical protein